MRWLSLGRTRSLPGGSPAPVRGLRLLCGPLLGLVLVLAAALPAAAADDFSIVIFGDTQKMVRSSGPEPRPGERRRVTRFARMIDWVIAEREARRIDLVLHVGDAINAGDLGVETPKSAGEWARFNAEWKRLDGVVPYLIARGNHDDRVEFARHYGAAHFAALAARFDAVVYLGSVEPHQDAHALEVALGGQPTLVLSASCNPPPREMEFLRAQLAAHPELPAVLVTHILTWAPGIHIPSTNKRDPDCSQNQPAPRLWEDLVVPHARQFVLTASGHVVVGDDPAISGSKAVEQIGAEQVLDTFQNFQGFSDEPAGYALTLVQFRPGEGTVSVETIVPLRDPPAAPLAREGRTRLGPVPFRFGVQPSPSGPVPVPGDSGRSAARQPRR